MNLDQILEMVRREVRQGTWQLPDDLPVALDQAVRQAGMSLPEIKRCVAALRGVLEEAQLQRAHLAREWADMPAPSGYGSGLQEAGSLWNCHG